MVAISFSIIMSCSDISLLLVTVGIVYSRVGKIISVVINILFDGENISLDANLVMYINSTSIPPIMIINRMYENQNLLYMVPLMRHTNVVMYINCNRATDINVLHDTRSTQAMISAVSIYLLQFPTMTVLLQVLPDPFQSVQQLHPPTEQRAVRAIELYHRDL